jgi:hypothetical protein
MKYLCQPEQYLKYHVLKIIRLLNDHKSLIEAFDNFINEVRIILLIYSINLYIFKVCIKFMSSHVVIVLT